MVEGEEERRENGPIYSIPPYLDVRHRTHYDTLALVLQSILYNIKVSLVVLWLRVFTNTTRTDCPWFLSCLKHTVLSMVHLLTKPAPFTLM